MIHRGHGMAQVVSCRPHIVETRVCTLIGPCGTSGGQSGSGTRLSQSSSVFFPVNIIPPWLPTLIHLGDKQYGRC
jgi:hypothetical protein